MTTPWIPVSQQLPPDGKYVLIHLTKDNWRDHTDPEGVYFKVAKLERGSHLLCGNNMTPYEWNNFGPGNYFGQEVDYWMDIPKLP